MNGYNWFPRRNWYILNKSNTRDRICFLFLEGEPRSALPSSFRPQTWLCLAIAFFGQVSPYLARYSSYGHLEGIVAAFPCLLDPSRLERMCARFRLLEYGRLARGRDIKVFGQGVYNRYDTVEERVHL